MRRVFASKKPWHCINKYQIMLCYEILLYPGFIVYKVYRYETFTYMEEKKYIYIYTTGGYNIYKYIFYIHDTSTQTLYIIMSNALMSNTDYAFILLS